MSSQVLLGLSSLDDRNSYNLPVVNGADDVEGNGFDDPHKDAHPCRSFCSVW